MIKYFVVLIILLTNNVFAEEPIKIELENKDNNLRLYLIGSPGLVFVNKRFSFDHSPSTPRDIDFEFVDTKGEKYPFTSMVDGGPVEEKDIVFLWPGDIIGREFIKRYLISKYSLEPRIYKVRAIYENIHDVHWNWIDSKVYTGRLTSNWVIFEVTEKDMENIYGENWRKLRHEYFRKGRETEKRTTIQ